MKNKLTVKPPGNELGRVGIKKPFLDFVTMRVQLWKVKRYESCDFSIAFFRIAGRHGCVFCAGGIEHQKTGSLL
jgi:hypothetical protein